MNKFRIIEQIIISSFSMNTVLLNGKSKLNKANINFEDK